MLQYVEFISPQHFGASFQGFCDAFLQRHGGKGTSLQLALMVVDTFPSFRDETVYEGQKRACHCMVLLGENAD